MTKLFLNHSINYIKLLYTKVDGPKMNKKTIIYYSNRGGVSPTEFPNADNKVVQSALRSFFFISSRWTERTFPSISKRSLADFQVRIQSNLAQLANSKSYLSLLILKQIWRFRFHLHSC